MAGPLAGVKILELAGVGPGPFAGMVLADLGASVIRIDRLAPVLFADELTNRGKQSIIIDLKHPQGPEMVLQLVEGADALIEGFRPGVAERLGVGPDECLERNPGLVYGRITGWGQCGPLASTAGHDINFIAVAGVLAHLGRAGQPPTPPINLVGDYGGGGMLLVVGVLAALWEARLSGTGQVVDAAMVDGAALQMTMIHDLVGRGMWSDQRGSNLLDTGAPFYDVYRTADGEFMAVGAIEPQFRAEMLQILGVDAGVGGDLDDEESWPVLRAQMTEKFACRTRQEWTELFAGSNACVSPVLTLSEALSHPHNQARNLFVDVEGRFQPAAAPRFSRTALPEPAGVPLPGSHTDLILSEAGLKPSTISKLRNNGVIR